MIIPDLFVKHDFLNFIYLSQFKLEVLSEMAADFKKYMPVKPEIDQSSMLLAPMPGILKSLSVADGDTVSILLCTV